MKYLCLVYPVDDLEPTPAQVHEFVAFRAAANQAGVFVDSGRLQPADSATTVRRVDQQTVLTDGPFAEMKEHVGGYVLLDCPDLDDALKWAAMIPGGERGAAVEIRPLLEMPG
jgi:hypothetical protein